MINFGLVTRAELEKQKKESLQAIQNSPMGIKG
jgi:hypothetical protein